MVGHALNSTTSSPGRRSHQLTVRAFNRLSVGIIAGAACLVALTGCGGIPAHIAARRRREDSSQPSPAPAAGETSQLPAGALPEGAALAEQLSLSGTLSATASRGYAVQCGVYPGSGYAATVDLSLPGRVTTLSLLLPMYNGPGQYRVESAVGLATNVAAAKLSGFGSAEAGSVTVAGGGRAGTLDLTFDAGRGQGRPSGEFLKGSWRCAVAGVAYDASTTAAAVNTYQNLTVSGALTGHVSAAAVPATDLMPGAPNCGAFNSSSAGRFNLAMIVTLVGHHYVLDVLVKQYHGAGMYYPSFTPASLPIQTDWATAEVVRDAAPAEAGEIPSSTWAGVGGDFRLNSDLTTGLLAIRFMNRTGASFVITGSWSC